MTLRTSNSPTAWARATCSNCDRDFGTYVALTEGNNEAYVRCGECGHINAVDGFGQE